MNDSVLTQIANAIFGEALTAAAKQGAREALLAYDPSGILDEALPGLSSEVRDRLIAVATSGAWGLDLYVSVSVRLPYPEDQFSADAFEMIHRDDALTPPF